MIFMVRVQNLKCSKGSGHRRATGLIPSERTPKNMAIHVEFFYFMDFMWSYHGAKGVPEYEVEDGSLGILAPPVTWRRVFRTMGLIQSERSPKTMGNDVENDSFDELEPEISLVKGGPATAAGGRGHGQSGAPW